MFLTYTTKDKVLFFAFLLLISNCFAQVGINITQPRGALDINSTTQGLVLPRVALQATNNQAPVVNPKSGVTVIPTGTVVYNTATTSNGSNDVSPGMYSWDGFNWNIEFSRNQSRLYEQSSLDFRPRSNSGFQNITGLSNRSFLPTYTGKYRLKVDVNYGGATARVPNAGSSSDGNLNVARADGIFRFRFDGTDYIIPAHAFSTAYDSSVGATNYFAIWQEYSILLYVDLVASSSVSFTLSFDQETLPDFENNGNSGNGRGHIGFDIPCTVEFVYVGD
ncbi:MAG: hypothetical protein JKY22_03445 [Flavobacteriaceae bacterium]|nr:hypothetical protein [Flavobacteriaceae bacterium]